MYRAILCDDDEIISRGLSLCVPWEALGIEFCGYRNNGLEAKQLLDEVQPDILMSDICMPFMDGLQLTEYAKSVNPNIKVIIFSGYDDFRFAQKAIRVGAMDYMLKPVDDEALQMLLKRATDELDQANAQSDLIRDQKKRATMDRMRSLMFEGLRVFRQNFGPGALDEMRLAAGMAVIASIDGFEQLRYCMTSEEQQAINHNFYACFIKHAPGIAILEQSLGEVAGCVCAESTQAVSQSFRESVTLVREAFRILCPDLTISFALSNIHQKPEEMHRAYQEAVLASRASFVHPVGSIVRFSEVEQNEELNDEELDKIFSVSKLLMAIKQCDAARIDNEIEYLRKLLLKAGGRSRTLLQFYSNNIFHNLFQDLQQLGIDEKAVDINFLSEYERIGSQHNIDNALHQLREIALKVVEALESNSRSRNAQTIDEAIAYIEARYMDHSVSMDDVARQVHMSPSYFSVIFKRETCEAFTDYLIRLRIKKSIEMMRLTDLKVYEISAAVGYDTASYYSTAFKKETGYSPTEYKRIFIDGK